jgi:uncharacterized SAM-dependent methyltransferase
VNPQSEANFLRENEALARLLRRTLPAASRKTDRPLQILDLACGPCREASTLVQTLRERQPEASAIRFVGADIRRRELEEAAARARAADLHDAEFITTDCSQLDRIRSLGDNFDLAFLRHQNFWNDPAAWRRIFAHGLARLRDDGLLVITSYFDREHELATGALEAAGAELIVSTRNEESIALSTPGKSVDRHLAVFRRRRNHPL